ncbi:hypothetical protein CSC17_4295 [Klebsiella oxytoca]|nr:hypothetical protein CSC17_4295 [Klebsiella oxytoca]
MPLEMRLEPKRSDGRANCRSGDSYSVMVQVNHIYNHFL